MPTQSILTDCWRYKFRSQRISSVTPCSLNSPRSIGPVTPSPRSSFRHLSPTRLISTFPAYFVWPLPLFRPRSIFANVSSDDSEEDLRMLSLQPRYFVQSVSLTLILALLVDAARYFLACPPCKLHNGTEIGRGSGACPFR